MGPQLHSASMEPIDIDAVVELLTRVVSRRTRPGHGHVILSAAELDAWLRREVRGDVSTQEEASMRALRNELVHGVFTTNYDTLLELATQAHDYGHAPIDHQLLREQLRATRERLRGEEIEESWLDVAAVIADAFVQRLVENSEILTKLENDEAARIGRSAADAAVAALRWSQIVGPRLDTTAVTQLLGVTRQALAKRQIAGSLLGLPGHGTTWYPTWQFNLEAREIRPEVRDIVGAFRDRLDEMDPLLIASWAVTPQDEDLEGLTPEQWLRLGKKTHQLRLSAERAASRLAR
jgi:hypothetical protein